MTLSRTSNSGRAAVADYSRFLGRPYEPPLGCLRLAEAVYREQYGIDFGRLGEELDRGDGLALMKLLRDHADKVEAPQEGDLILLAGHPWHIGVVIGPGEMVHSYEGGAACIERYDGMLWSARMRGFWRVRPMRSVRT